MSKEDLKSRLDKSLAQSRAAAPSMVPNWTKKKDVEPEVIPDIREAVAHNTSRTQIAMLVAEISELKAQEKEARKLSEGLVKRLKVIVETQSTAPKFMVNGYKVTTYTTTRKSIKSDLLLAAGILPATIAKCTEVSTSVALKITAPGENEDGD